MKSNYLIVGLFTLLIFGSCDSDDSVHNSFKDCIIQDDFVQDLEVYRGQDKGCNFFIDLYLYQDENFYQLNSHCADLIRTYAFYENCVDICQARTSVGCINYINGREYVETVFIYK